MERPINQLALMATIICFTLTLLGVAVSAEEHLTQAKGWLLAEMYDDAEPDMADHHNMMEHDDHHDMHEGNESDMLDEDEEGMYPEDENMMMDDESMYDEIDGSEFDEYEDGDVDISEGDFEPGE